MAGNNSSSDDKSDDAAFNEGFAANTALANSVAALVQQDKLAATASVEQQTEKPQAVDDTTQAVALVAADAQTVADGDSAASGAAPSETSETPQRTSAAPLKASKRPLVKLTDDEIESLRAAAAKVAEQDKKLNKAFGTIGDLQAQLKALKASSDTKVGGEPKTRVPAQVSEVEQQLRNRAVEELEDAYADWRDIVGASDTPDPEHPFRKWLSTQPEAYQKRVNSSYSASVILRAIELFKASSAKRTASTSNGAQTNAKASSSASDKAAAARRDRIANAVPPKTAGSKPVNARTPDDDFNEGFATG